MTDVVTELPYNEFLEACEMWKADEMRRSDEARDAGEEELCGWDVIQLNLEAHPDECPIHQWAVTHGLCKGVTGGTEKCPLCSAYICPTCKSHGADVVSRVTGYLQVVSGWNAPKKQEFEDRTRYGLV